MSILFDASQISQEPVDAEILAEQSRKVQDLMQRPAALANAKLHAENEMQRLIGLCNRLAWGGMPPELRAPTAEEAAGLLAYLAADVRDRLVEEARRASLQRALLRQMEEAYQHMLAHLQAEEQERARQDEEARERAAFEIEDAAGKEQRYLAWRAARRSAL